MRASGWLPGSQDQVPCCQLAEYLALVGLRIDAFGGKQWLYPGLWLLGVREKIRSFWLWRPSTSTMVYGSQGPDKPESAPCEHSLLSSVSAYASQLCFHSRSPLLSCVSTFPLTCLFKLPPRAVCSHPFPELCLAHTSQVCSPLVNSAHLARPLPSSHSWKMRRYVSWQSGKDLPLGSIFGEDHCTNI